MVKPGYKQTEVGLIPEDWFITPLRDISIGKFTYGVNAPAVEYMPPLPNYIRITDISDDGRFMCENRSSVICEHPEQFTLKENDIVFARTGASTGKTYLYRREDGELVYAGFLIKASIDPSQADSRFVFAALHTSNYWNWVATASMRSGQPGINGNEYSSYQIAIPKLTEQAYIADALEDTDMLICSLEKQISKKKAIKLGAMQELLTGKKRLPGFSGEWQTFSFGALFDFIPNNAFTRVQMADSGKVKNIHYGDILTKYGAYVDGDSGAIPYITKEIDLARFAERCYLQSGDIIIADTAEDETVGKALEVIDVDCPILAGQHTLLCRPKIKFAEKFLGYYLNAACYHDQLIPYIVGTKVSSVSKASVAQTKLVVPGYEEQQAIAETLSNMDAEIEALQQKLEKYRQLKQGMMQQLLTGKIRLV